MSAILFRSVGTMCAQRSSLLRFSALPVARAAFSTGGEDTVVSTCTRKITELLNPVRIKVTSTNDDPNGSHIQVECVSEAFVGKNVVQRHKLVYKAIWEELNGPVHAVDSIVAKTPKEVGL
uniref:BolA-like protein n=1 Tax=Spumella elongata TaxID=89044 RepID=A0A7S3M2T1_9STRA|eukprot:gene8034-9573_t